MVDLIENQRRGKIECEHNFLLNEVMLLHLLSNYFENDFITLKLILTLTERYQFIKIPPIF